MKGICKSCGREQFIVNKKYQLCDDCNYIRLHGITRFEAVLRKDKNRVVGLPNKDRKVVRTNKNKEKDYETYYEVFRSNPDRCEECGCELPNKFLDENGLIIYPEQYSHILSKGAWPEFRHNPKNFNRLCFKHHRQWEDGDRESMNIYEKNQFIIKELFNERLSKSS